MIENAKERYFATQVVTLYLRMRASAQSTYSYGVELGALPTVETRRSRESDVRQIRHDYHNPVVPRSRCRCRRIPRWRSRDRRLVQVHHLRGYRTALKSKYKQ